MPVDDAPQLAEGVRHVVLVGMMGAGKTTVGARLARRLGLRLVDSDAQVEARTGRNVREIFESEGEAAYRALETEALAAALADETPTVVAAAGGTVLDPVNRQRMKQGGTVVWLVADPAVLHDRVADGGDHRPLLAGDPEGVLRRLEEQRRPLYAEVADHLVDVGDADPDEVVDRIVELVTA